MMKRGLEVLVAFEEGKPRNVPMGLVEYLPIECAPEPVKGEDVAFVDCIWVIPQFWRRGVAKALMGTLIEEVEAERGVAVLAYEGDRWFGYFEYMSVRFFERFGFREVDRDSTRVLLHNKPEEAEHPHLLTPKSAPKYKERKCIIDILWNSQCPWSGWMVELVKRNVKNHPNIILNIVNTNNRRVIEELGLSRGVFINGRPAIKRMAPWEEIRPILEQSLRESSD
ncbi:MAG: GNAT family N-acetyltransferase [Candidatus Bathyarchaeia archaeon]